MLISKKWAEAPENDSYLGNRFLWFGVIEVVSLKGRALAVRLSNVPPIHWYLSNHYGWDEFKRYWYPLLARRERYEVWDIYIIRAKFVLYQWPDSSEARIFNDLRDVVLSVHCYCFMPGPLFAENMRWDLFNNDDIVSYHTPSLLKILNPFK